MNKLRASRCTQHHFGCDCREYAYKEMRIALRQIRAQAEIGYKLTDDDEAKRCLGLIRRYARTALEALPKKKEEDK